MGISAVDIITYIGIPLAVLGVLPTIYTCLKSYLTLRAITQSLDRNGVTAITRSALLSGIIEIEIPRRSIQPLSRSDPRYFKVNSSPSSLKGGSWTLFHWQEMAIGVKSYRVQYHDELAQPQAEVEFEALIAFLLDRGAVPSKAGWADLRAAGLWTPAGTKLLVSPVSGEDVLSVARSDDSDGILSLGLKWRLEWDKRDTDSLPPYWIRVRAPRESIDILAALEKLTASPLVDTEEKEAETDLDKHKLKNSELPALRIRIAASGIQEAYTDSFPPEPNPLLHLRPLTSQTNSTPPFWFSIAATALQAPNGGLWSFNIPPDVLQLARRDSIPCGIMVLLGAMTDEQVPTWRTPHDEQADRFEAHVKLMEQSRRMNEESRLPPAQREEARRRRVETEAMDFHNDFRRRRFKEEQRREKEVVEACGSQKLPVGVVAGRNLEWLLARLEVPEEDRELLTVPTLVEQVLYGMARDPAFASRIASMLDLWRSWSLSGGMTRGHWEAVREDQVAFSLASFVLGVVRDTVSEPTGSVVGDLQECLRVWSKVRLG